MEALFDGLSYWHWWILGALLLVVELLAPGIIFLWLAMAAGVTGGLLLLVPGLGWEIQVLVFSVLGVISVLAGRRIWRHRPADSDHPTLNRRGSELIGRRYPLERAIESGSGRIRVGESMWLVHGPDAPAGTLVEVLDVDGPTLVVRPAETPREAS